MKSYNPTIIVVAFSRPKALLRSLLALNKAHYRCGVNLIISIDGGGCEEVIRIAEEFKFRHGIKRVINKGINLGLRSHILECGDLSKDEGSVIILEDDIVVDKFFHLYAQDALNYYCDTEDIAGISLYSPEFNEYVGLPFKPLKSEYDTYMMQVPSSWGQAWTSKQWSMFRQWQEKCSESIFQDVDSIPDYVKSWKSSSWKKYFALYLADVDKYFVYPYLSLTTNVSDPGGVHNDAGSNIVQVSIASQYRRFREFYFAPLGDNEVKYDSFMENSSKYILDFMKDFHHLKGSLCFDLYGSKSIPALQKWDYCVTSKSVRSSIRRYALDYRPQENNVIFNRTTDNGHLIFSLSESQEVMSSNMIVFNSSLMYWAGFNFLAKKFAIINLKTLIRKLWIKL
jgi:hypothetical protein